MGKKTGKGKGKCKEAEANGSEKGGPEKRQECNAGERVEGDSGKRGERNSRKCEELRTESGNGKGGRKRAGCLWQPKGDWDPGEPGGVKLPEGAIKAGGIIDQLQQKVGNEPASSNDAGPEASSETEQTKNEKGKDDNRCEENLRTLLEYGEHLDEPTKDKDFWREVPWSTEQWKMPVGDTWVESHLRIRGKVGLTIPMTLNLAQMRYSYDCALSRSKKNIVLKARQVGMTSYIAARYFAQTVTRPGTLTMLVAHDRESAEEIFRIVHRFWDNLKDELRDGPLKTSHSSARELVFPHLDSEFTVASADENAGRGRTIQNLHCTEVSRWGREGAEALASLRAAVVPGGEIVLESTANGSWGAFYQEWDQAEETGYLKHFFPWWYEESYRIETGPSFEMTSEEAELAEAHGLSKEQIAWRRQQWASLRGLAPQEFAEDAVACFRASGECVFELEVVDKAIAAASDPLETQDNGRLAIYMPPRPGKRYVIGVDPAGGGVNGDYSCAQVIDRESGMQCAEMHGHYLHKELARKLVELAKRYNSATVAVERNNHGAGVLAHLEREEYPHLYNEKGWNGWNTSAASRPAMLGRLTAVMMEKPKLFSSARLWNECRTFVRTASGRPEAAPGAHDDCVMAMAIALAVREVTAEEDAKAAGSGR